MIPVLRAAAAAALAAVLMLPVAIVATFLLLPMWSWMDAHWGVEAVGHASLAEWCFVATWLAMGLPVAVLAYRSVRRRRAMVPAA